MVIKNLGNKNYGNKNLGNHYYELDKQNSCGLQEI